MKHSYSLFKTVVACLLLGLSAPTLAQVVTGQNNNAVKAPDPNEEPTKGGAAPVAEDLTPQCYTQPPTGASSSLGSLALSQGISNMCGTALDYAPLASAPIKKVRLMVHVFQRNDGSGNWQPGDIALIQGFINGQRFPNPTSSTDPYYGGVNDVYGNLATPTAATNAELPSGPAITDSRIRFQLEAADVRFYRDESVWNMGAMDGSCFGAGNQTTGAFTCSEAVYKRYVTNSTTLTTAEKDGRIHIFLGESPAGPGPPINQYGVAQGRYYIGGIGPGHYLLIRGLYWYLNHHPTASIYGVAYPGPRSYALDDIQYLFSHELGHCLGLFHTFDVGYGDGCRASSGVYPDTATTNNLMDYPATRGAYNYSLTACQVGAMHQLLMDSGLLDAGNGTGYYSSTLASEPCTHSLTATTITASDTWRDARNLPGDLIVGEVGNNVTLRLQCRLGFAGPRAKIIVRSGSRLLISGGAITQAGMAPGLCPGRLEILLGGDPTNPTNGDNGGVKLPQFDMRHCSNLAATGF